MDRAQVIVSEADKIGRNSTVTTSTGSGILMDDMLESFKAFREEMEHKIEESARIAYDGQSKLVTDMMRMKSQTAQKINELIISNGTTPPPMSNSRISPLDK